MRYLILTWLSILLGVSLAQTQWPVHENGYSKHLKWDHYSLMIDDQRTFVWSGEFHPWRIPVPEVWEDLLQKVKAAGFNTVSLVLHWGFHSPNPDTVDVETGARNIDKLLSMCKDAGLFVTFRNGPYVNAETNAGGFALWLTTGEYGTLRNKDPRYQAAWEPFMTATNKISAKHTYDVGGTLILQQIENEISGQRLSNGEINHEIADYMVALEDNARQNGVTIPLLTNAPNMRSLSWSQDYLPGPGATDLYGVDSYPACWSCNLSECGSVREFTTVEYFPHFEIASPTQPSFIPEFQGGSYNPWGGPQGGCGGPGTLLDAEFVNVFYRDLAAQRITMISLYMIYGGTNWGQLATNLVGTSYDYSAPIRETRELQDKYSETKLVGLFFRTATDLTKTERKNLTSSLTSVSTVGATELRNPDTGAGFYVVRHMDSADQSSSDIKLNVTTKSGQQITIPQIKKSMIHLEGRQSKVIVTDFTFGEKGALIYSTAEVLSHSIVDGQSVLALWVPDGETGEFALARSKRLSVLAGGGVSFRPIGQNLVVTFTAKKDKANVLEFDNFKVILLSRTLAYRFWAPTLTNNPVVKAEDVVFVTGPYLVRSVSIEGSSVVVNGDNNGATALEVYAPEHVTSIRWNGKTYLASRTPYGSLKTQLFKPKFTLDTLKSQLASSLDGEWKYADGVPEAEKEYDDSKWVVADKTTSPNPTRQLTTPVSLYVDEYGYHSGVQIFRGRFDGSSSITGANLELQGGTAFGWSAWLNGVYVGSFAGAAGVDSGALEVKFPEGALDESGENVLTVVMDNSGHNQRAEAVYPRGILNYSLLSSASENATVKEWRLQGNAGGTSNIDPVRGNLHEGGLHAERVGWHLPGYNFGEGSWEEKELSQGVEGGRIGFFVKEVDLNVPTGYDAYLEIVLGSIEGSVLRAQIYVNGYQYGKYIPQVGNQIAFPIPPGILDYRGSNIIALNIWSQSNETAAITAEWNVVGVYESSFGNFDGSYLRPGWTEDRLEYA
ncbi:glycoside hydrolase superfamily [Flagelloscypha sp. PMI_526]|nr:glycoside hydrolase superfamily [Flagelloscypha sp. PMI_526]